ncbi:MAG: metal-dependent transcriptional regulator [Deltaproteobacteria bacterium]|nr:metal-dependent transcriptional regulator [Deltaproteobacteria bacterium]
MLENIEEVLEAIWIAKESGSSTIEDIMEKCSYKLQPETLDEMIEDTLIVKHGDNYDFTHRGKNMAEIIIRRHRLTDVLLQLVLGMTDSGKREAVACEAEHILPHEMVDSICTLLGHPLYTGDSLPIPRGRCCIANRTEASQVIVSLGELCEGDEAKIVYIKPKNHSVLKKLFSFGLIPGIKIRVIQKSPAVTIQFDKTELALDEQMVENIHVSRVVNQENIENIKRKKENQKGKGLFGAWRRRRHKGYD